MKSLQHLDLRNLLLQYVKAIDDDLYDCEEDLMGDLVFDLQHFHDVPLVRD